MFGDAEFVEVVFTEFDFGAFDDGEAEVLEDVEHLAEGLSDGVEAADASGAAGEGDVDGLGTFEGGAAELGLAFLEGGFEFSFEDVGCLADEFALFGVEVADGAEDAGECAAAPEGSGAPLLEGGVVVGGSEAYAGVVLDCGKLVAGGGSVGGHGVEFTEEVGGGGRSGVAVGGRTGARRVIGACFGGGKGAGGD